MNRISIYVDGPNFFFMQKKELEWFIDPKKILEYVKNRFQGEIVDARYYQSVRDNKSDSYHTALTYMGYSVHISPCKMKYDGGEEWLESDVTIEMMLDMLDTSPTYDTVVLVSGSGEFEQVVERLKARGKRVILLTTEAFLSRDLRSKVGQGFTDFKDIREEVLKE